MRYHNITKDDMLNGDGLRVVLWVSGCEHRCPDCHNKLTWDADDGLEFDSAAKAEIWEQLSKSYISGITFSGGDPLHPVNEKAVEALMAEIKHTFPNKTIWLYTGYVWEQIRDKSLMQYVDVCVDGPFLKEQFDSKLLWKGSKNQRVIDVPRSLMLSQEEHPVLHANDYFSRNGERNESYSTVFKSEQREFPYCDRR